MVMGTSTMGPPCDAICRWISRAGVSGIMHRRARPVKPPAPRACCFLRWGYIFADPKETAMQSTVIGGAMLPHAPQFFTMPETEDKALVAHVREVAADIGKRLRALKPD